MINIKILDQYYKKKNISLFVNEVRNIMTECETTDIFHRGRFCLVQSAQRGHRAGIDAMILASCVPHGFVGKVADLGSGVGAAGFAVLSRCPEARVTLVEHSPLMLSFAEKTLAHPFNAEFTQRVDLIAADVTLTGEARNQAGLSDNSFDFVIMNPPFNNRVDRVTPDSEKAKAHVMRKGLFDIWLRTAAAIIRSHGGLALIARPSSVREILSALNGRFGGVRIVPVYPRHSLMAIRIVIAATRASRAIPQILPPLVLHGEEGNTFLPRAEGINNGWLSLWNEV